MPDGLYLFDRLISSDETPPYLMVVGDEISGGDVAERYEVLSTTARSVSTEYRKPRDAADEQLTQIWEKTLDITPIGIDDDFTELGGDSISAIMVQVAVEQAFGTDLPFSVLFRHPTIAELTEVIKSQGNRTSG